MYELYITNKNYTTWALRPWVLMRERDIAFRERLVPFGSSSFRAFSPSGRVPALHDGDVVVWDSLAIVEYLAERHAGVWPADPIARAWARSAAAEMHSSFSALRSRCTNSCGLRIRLHDYPPELAGDVARLTELWSEGLASSGGPFLAGSEFTARRRVLRAGGVSCADLRVAVRGSRGRISRAVARVAGDARMVRGRDRQKPSAMPRTRPTWRRPAPSSRICALASRSRSRSSVVEPVNVWFNTGSSLPARTRHVASFGAMSRARPSV